jgi:hypothetical protein
MDDVAPEGLPREITDLLRDPNIYLSADQLALDQIKAWVYAPESPTATQSATGTSFPLDRYLWAVGGRADSSTTPSAA